MEKLHTERLVLRVLQKKDAKAIFHYRSSKDNFPFVEMPIYKHIKDAHAYIEKMNEGMAEKKWYCFALALKQNDDIIGTISIWNFDDLKTTVELGYGLFPGHTGKGMMTEALIETVRFCFEQLGLKRVEAYTSVENGPSNRLLMANGFVKEKEVTDSYSELNPAPLMAVYAIENEL